MSSKLLDFIYQKDFQEDEEFMKITLYSKRRDLLLHLADSTTELPIIKDSIKYLEDKIEKIKDDKSMNIKLQKAKVDLKHWEDQLEICLDNLRKQGNAFRIIDEKYNEVSKFTKDVKKTIHI